MVKQLRQRYAETKASIDHEYAMADAQRLLDYRVALEEFVRVHINSEQTVMAILTDLQRRQQQARQQ